MEGGKLIINLKTIVNEWTFGYGIRKKLLFEILVTLVILYECEVWGCNNSRDSWRKIEQIQNIFITYNLKIKNNTPYPILLIEASFSPIESTTMTMYLMYKNKLNNMKDKRLPKITSNSSENHLRLKQGWHTHAQFELNHWGINEEIIIKDKDNIKNIHYI
jgi:hypothetical protein